MGRRMTHNEYISSCVTCRWLRRPAEQQKMAWFPEDRLEPASPFSYCAVDYFGPFIVKERRSQVKRYRVLFTCVGSRSVHLETANSPDSSSFINALGRFMSPREAVRQLRSDQGTNFVGSQNELKAALSEMNHDHVQEYLLTNGCKWIPYKMNLPHCSHMGGTWERWLAVYATNWNHYYRRLGANLTMRLCEHSWQKSSALSTEDVSVWITYVMHRHRST